MRYMHWSYADLLQAPATMVDVILEEMQKGGDNNDGDNSW